ncbi:MAG: hypothetical protein LN414_08425, partial [Candidatus Thermoplasmatota archaeon]|nr:hypothetical protein [Candidatus Thermoplasmatota archaeon]
MLGMHSEPIEDPLHDETCRKILLLTSKRELTGPAIAYTLDLPLAPCYRKIAALQRAGYLTIAGYSVNARRRAHKIYRAKMDGIEVGQLVDERSELSDVGSLPSCDGEAMDDASIHIDCDMELKA